MLWKISVITLEGCCSCSSAQRQFIATIYSKAWHTSAVVKSWREIITRRRIHALLAEGRWLTVSIYRTSLPCRGGVRSLCVSPCLWREAFLAPVYTEGWKNLITHTLRNHNAHYAALTTFTCRLQVQTLTHAFLLDKNGKQHRYWEMTHIRQICCEWHTCHELTCVNSVFFYCCHLQLPLLNHTLRNGWSQCVTAVLCEEGRDECRGTCRRDVNQEQTHRIEVFTLSHSSTWFNEND